MNKDWDWNTLTEKHFEQIDEYPALPWNWRSYTEVILDHHGVHTVLDFPDKNWDWAMVTYNILYNDDFPEILSHFEHLPIDWSEIQSDSKYLYKSNIQSLDRLNIAIFSDLRMF